MYKEGAAATIDQVHCTAQEDGHDDTDALVVPAVTIQTSTLWTMVEPGEVRLKWCHRYHCHFETQLYEIARCFVILAINMQGMEFTPLKRKPQIGFSIGNMDIVF